MKIEMVTCDGKGRVNGQDGHAPIMFEGVFTALCPLCEALEGIENAQFDVVKHTEDAADLRSTVELLEQDVKDAQDEREVTREEKDAEIKQLTEDIVELKRAQGKK